MRKDYKSVFSVFSVIQTKAVTITLHSLSTRVCKVFGINRHIHCRRELRFPTDRDSEIARTSFIYIFLQNIYTPSAQVKFALSTQVC